MNISSSIPDKGKAPMREKEEVDQKEKQEATEKFNQVFSIRRYRATITVATAIRCMLPGFKRPIIKIIKARISRDDSTGNDEGILSLCIYGYSEWLEIIGTIKNRKSKFSKDVIDQI
ncbi:hypothetical protein L6452_05475 [Arctium lappa]|uniref:Uncharacterized protein n=1 Tax=Arctium lappa TaxID=4217 RepID=A0ACB9EHK4_ARCLA|nr:hypothetical protein L6452_05475 [Arctium lappa]